jgi:hypothetical protein
MNFQTVVDVSQVAAALTVIGGAVFAVFEAMGVLVHRRIAPRSLVQDLVGGVIVVIWRRLQPWLTQLRSEQSNPSDLEWLQWLAEQLEQRRAEKLPAYLQHRSWVP